MTSRVFSLFFVVFCCANAELNDPKYYTAGVVEFRPNLYGMSSADMLADHLEAYDEIIRSAAANETDIIIFPEGTLNNAFSLTFVPAPKDEIIPCLENNDSSSSAAAFLKRLSCTARDVRKYLVINLTEKENCTAVENDPRPCASNGLNIFNTNVVFDRFGRVVSRYRKVHIYVEAKNTTLEPEFGVFETDFGVRFGHFICFDILFFTPAQELVVKHGIRNVIFTSLFYSELPFLTASQLQQSWAWGNNVNLLAAGASYPAAGITGTGLYAGAAGHIKAIMQGDNGVRQLFVAKLPKNPEDYNSTDISERIPAQMERTPQTGVKLMKDPQLMHYNSVLLELTQEFSIARSLCHGQLCCDLHMSGRRNELSTAAVDYEYRFGVFDGRRTYEKEEWSDIQVCGLYACTSVEEESCGEIFERGTDVEMSIIFETIEIKGYFERAKQVLIMPNSLNDKLYSLNSDAVVWKNTDNGTHYVVDFKLTKSNDELLTFGIYAHYYERSIGSRFGEFWSTLLTWIFMGTALRVGGLL